MSDREKWLSIGVLGKAPPTKTVVEKHKGGSVAHTEHRDGRVDATVRPDVVRFKARAHKTGKHKGEVAEIRRADGED